MCKVIIITTIIIIIIIIIITYFFINTVRVQEWDSLRCVDDPFITRPMRKVLSVAEKTTKVSEKYPPLANTNRVVWLIITQCPCDKCLPMVNSLKLNLN